MPEWSKGVDLRSTVFARVGSNPTFGIGESVNGEHGAFARLAQLVEHRSYEPKVTGSSPVLSIFIINS